MEDYYYHITDPNNALNIMQEGLRANDSGLIFLFENKGIALKFNPIEENGKLVRRMLMRHVSDDIAINQIGLNEYVMFQISAEGITSELIPDDVDEYGAIYQWKVKQNAIEPQYIEVCGLFRTDPGKLVIED